MERLINRRQQGDLGEASAIDWFTRAGAAIFLPIGHSPDYDLVVDDGHGLLRVQVKTSTQDVTTSGGHRRCPVMLATNGGNQSWTGRVKKFETNRFDLLFALTGDGRRWLIPSKEIEGANSLTLGGPKYSEFEIEPADAIRPLVYGDQTSPLESNRLGEYPSGQRTATVNRQAQPSQVRILPPPLSPSASSRSEAPKPRDQLPMIERGQSPRGQTRVSGNRQIVIPKRAFEAAGLARGDRLKAFSTGPGEVMFRRVARERNDGAPA
jgi:PD-(D/E)XK endonuclease